MRDKFYVAIDPGISGGIAWSVRGRDYCCNMPSTTVEFIALFETFKKDAKRSEVDIEVFLEKVHARPGNGSASSWKFAQHFGEIRGVLLAKEIRFIEETPSKWMKHFGMKKSKQETDTQWKNRLKALAKQYYPELKVTLKTSDAILMLERLKTK